jgi:hypothetical protein
MRENLSVQSILKITPYTMGAGVFWVVVGIIESLGRAIDFFARLSMILLGAFLIGLTVNRFGKALVFLAERKHDV